MDDLDKKQKEVLRLCEIILGYPSKCIRVYTKAYTPGCKFQMMIKEEEEDLEEEEEKPLLVGWEDTPLEFKPIEGEDPLMKELEKN